MIRARWNVNFVRGLVMRPSDYPKDDGAVPS